MSNADWNAIGWALAFIFIVFTTMFFAQILFQNDKIEIIESYLTCENIVEIIQKQKWESYHEFYFEKCIFEDFEN